jgi:hypothetical protein
VVVKRGRRSAKSKANRRLIWIVGTFLVIVWVAAHWSEIGVKSHG